MTQPCDFSIDTYQPTREIYTNVLATQYAESAQLKQYVVLVFYLLKNYLELHDLIQIFLTCRSHEEGTTDLRNLVSEKDLSDFSVTGKKLNNEKQLLMNNKENLALDKIQEVSERGRRKRQTKASLAKTKTDSLSQKQEVPMPRDYSKALIEDVEIYRELKFHIRGFRSHLKMISLKKDSKEAFDCQLRLLLLAMRALYVT